MAFPPKKAAGPVDPEMDAVNALMAGDTGGGEEAAEGELPAEKPAAGNPEQLLAEIEGALAQLRQIVAR